MGTGEIVIAVAALIFGPTGAVFVALNGTKKKVDEIHRTVTDKDHGNAALNGRLMVLEDRGERAV